MAFDAETSTPTGRAIAPGRSWVSWGAVFSGALIGSAVMTLLSLLWYAIATAGPNFVSDNIAWFLGGTAIVSTFLAGLFAGWFVSRRDLTIGAVQGLTEWGLLTFAVVIVGPGLATILRSMLAMRATVTGSTWLWASFWSVLIGLAAAVIGGIVGGTMVVRDRRTAAADLAPADTGDRGEQQVASRPGEPAGADAYRSDPESRRGSSDPYHRSSRG